MRRIVDLINQETFYQGSVLTNKYHVSGINDYNQLLKKYYRKINILNLSNYLYQNGKESIDGYVYNVENLSLSIYIPDKNIALNYKFLLTKYQDRCRITINNETVEVIINDIQYVIPLFKKIHLHLLGKPDILNINGSIKVDFSQFK